VHVRSRSVIDPTPRGVRHRTRRGAGRGPQPGAASSARLVVERSPAARGLSGRRPVGARRTVVERVDRRCGAAGRTDRVHRSDFCCHAEHHTERRADLHGGHTIGGHDQLMDSSQAGSIEQTPTRSARALLRVIYWYQSGMEGRPSPCRFTPSCSSYALDAVAHYGTARGLVLIVRRTLRCRPFGPSGWDPIPETFLRKRADA